MKKLIYLLLIAFTMTACGALKIEHKMREVELGMPKKKGKPPIPRTVL